jgi:hypothetical protein
MQMWQMQTCLSSFFRLYTISSVAADVVAGISGCQHDCEACGGGGANYCDCDGHSLVSGDNRVVVLMEVADDKAVICANATACGFMVHGTKLDDLSSLLQ